MIVTVTKMPNNLVNTVFSSIKKCNILRRHFASMITLFQLIGMNGM